MSYATKKLGKRVRFLPDFYITRLIPEAEWEGVITDVNESMMGQSTTYKVRLDERFRSEDVQDAKDEEMEEL